MTNRILPPHVIFVMLKEMLYPHPTMPIMRIRALSIEQMKLWLCNGYLHQAKPFQDILENDATKKVDEYLECLGYKWLEGELVKDIKESNPYLLTT